MRMQRQGPGWVVRNLTHLGTTHEYAYAFPLTDPPHAAAEALGVGRALVQHALQLLLDVDRLAVYPTDAQHPFTRTLIIDGGKRRVVVVTGAAEAERVRRLVRGLRYDQAQVRRAAFEALA